MKNIFTTMLLFVGVSAQLLSTNANFKSIHDLKDFLEETESFGDKVSKSTKRSFVSNMAILSKANKYDFKESKAFLNILKFLEENSEAFEHSVEKGMDEEEKGKLISFFNFSFTIISSYFERVHNNEAPMVIMGEKHVLSLAHMIEKMLEICSEDKALEKFTEDFTLSLSKIKVALGGIVDEDYWD